MRPTLQKDAPANRKGIPLGWLQAGHIIHLMLFKYLLCGLGVILAVPVLALMALAITLPISISGIGYLLACLVGIAGLILAPRMKHHSLLIVAGLSVLTLIAAARIILGAWSSNSNLSMITLPQGKGTRWISYILDEQDSLIFGEALFHRIGGSSAREHENLAPLLYQDYADIRREQKVIPSPIVDTFLNLQSPGAFDIVIIKPEVNRHPEVGVIFLHGFMGNVTAQCWEIAQAVNRFGAVTVCPSTEWTGDWSQPQGEAILRSTFQYLREQAIQQIYLGGFSNGGFGISRLVSRIAKEESLRGLFFIDGIYDGASIRDTGLPVLVIEGAQDERVPATVVRQIAEIIGDSGTYVELAGDHFLIMKQPGPVQDALATWLKDRESNR